jgi:hypothetical protein
MDPIDILYTPLDIPPLPDVDVAEVEQWMADVYPQSILKEVPGSKRTQETFGDNYPWNLAFIKFGQLGWRDGFETKFPKLASYMHEAYGLDPDDLNSITFLPMRTNVTGLGFWHADNDESGLRFYLRNDSPDENPLLIRQTVLPHAFKTEEMKAFISKDLNFKNHLYKDDVMIAKISPTSPGFYVNNVRAIHSPFITKYSPRIACFLQPNAAGMAHVKQKTRQLIIDSAEKYKEYALLWKP